MKADILKLLLQAHTESDEPSFRKAALQLAASESSAGHVRVAEELRAMIAKLPPTKAGAPVPATSRNTTIVDIATPRGDLADVLQGRHPDERFRDIVLPTAIRALLERIIAENRARARLEAFGVSPRRRLLFHGAPGCGKTLAAAVLAGEMGLPLMTVRFDALFSRFLGATAVQLRTIFAEMPKRPGVYLFDEFDAVAKARGDAQDVGEMNRVVTSFLQLVDADQSSSVLVAATNHVELLDRAVFRRFDTIVPFEKPSIEQAAALMQLRLEHLGATKEFASSFATALVGASFADVTRVCDDAVRNMVLDGRELLNDDDLTQAIGHLQQRSMPTGV
jgi:SpoVK/Ycf46/Vps4 family AAA+-type ATPase